MALSCGIVGLPNAGKSTLFNALCSRKLAETDVRPFTTIDPHEAVVAVPDADLVRLSKLVKPQKTISAAVTFIDIAGLVKGAHKGEGLGNQFLAKIREVDAIIHVVRCFSDPKVAHQHPSFEPGSEKQVLEDIEIINLELKLGGIGGKPTIYVLNLDQAMLGEEKSKSLISSVKKKFKGEIVAVSASFEEEMIELTETEKKDFLELLEGSQSGLERLIKRAYSLLDLISFYTIKGGSEVHAWSLKAGSDIIKAAAKVHTDFAVKFIKAEVIDVKELLAAGGWKQAKEKGKVRLEGREYIVKDKEVVEFIISK